ncbi:MAG: branched-chain amino acid aminotransferase [Promethearchaeota archaeon]
MPQDPNKLGFGRIFTDHMLLCDWKDGQWMNPKIIPYGDLSLSPAAVVLHYGQEIFEGLKAYYHDDGKISLFRPYENAKRFNQSAERIVMPAIDEEFFVEGIKKLINIDKEWVPKNSETSLYIRPAMIGTEGALGVRPSAEYLYFVILSPVGPYFKTGFKPAKIYVSQEYARAAPGGCGDAKAGGNYAASLYVGKMAKDLGYQQVLWLDACEREYVEEVGAMNMFFVFGETLVTAPLKGTILPGITRESVIHLAKHKFGYKMEERRLSIHEITKGINDGTLTEAFGSGTAAVITPVGELFFDNEPHQVNQGKIGKITQQLYDEITGIQKGRIPDEYGWNLFINE